MRARIFKRIMRFLEQHPSRIFARIEFQILLLATAKAFEKKGKIIFFSKDARKEYAEFTKACMQRPADRKRLYRISFQLGRRIRKIAGFTDPDKLQRLVYFLYRNIGITMTGEIPGVVTVSRCYFSRIYSEEQCHYISAMDNGIINGICGGGKMVFTERITSGCAHCTACIATNNRKNM